MNSLLIFDGEGWEEGAITLTGERARQIFSSYEFVIGQDISVARLGGEKGRAQVVHYASTSIKLNLLETHPSLALRPIDLIVGLSRPQTTKKVIQAAVMSGVRSLHFVHTELGEKSYLDSHVLRPKDLETEVVKALEQIGEGLYPAIHVYRSFFELRARLLNSAPLDPMHLRLVAVPYEPLVSVSLFEQKRESLMLAVGPEVGWSKREVTRLKDCGFMSVGLGPRVLRVEVALTFLLGQSLLMPFSGD